MKSVISLFILSLVLVSCNTEKVLTAQEIVDQTISVSGGEKYYNYTLDFDFRDKHYRGTRDGGSFQYERHFKDSVNSFKDVLNNDGFKRFINDTLAQIPDSMAVKYTSSVNSVHYFAMLPYGLNDAAVNKSRLDNVSIKGKDYYKIRISFNEEGGGEDFEDIFIYWINTETFRAEYIAYSYIESNGVGIRFREAYNERIVNGLRFVDYNNYKSEEASMDLLNLDKAFAEGSLKLLSKIELKNISVQ